MSRTSKHVDLADHSFRSIGLQLMEGCGVQSLFGVSGVSVVFGKTGGE